MGLETSKPDAADILLTGLLTTLRRTRSPKWCGKKLVGPLRAMMGEGLRVQGLTPELDEARTKAAALLHRHCRLCGACKLGRR